MPQVRRRLTYFVRPNSDMKALSTGIVCLMVGLIVGWYLGHSQEKHETNEAVQQMMATMESYDAAEAVTSIRAISLIESGQVQKASEYLSKPIATYAQRFGHLQPTEDRTNVLQKIKAAALQFPVVARALGE